MGDKKYFLKSRRFWGLVASALGFLLLIFGEFFGHDFSSYVQTFGIILQTLGIPFTAYNALNADRPVGFKK
jgi:hypothetical protein